MRTSDPFLRHLFGAMDRAAVWCVLALVITALAWTAAWERGLGVPALDGWRLLLAAMSGRSIDRHAVTLLALCVGFGASGATVIGGWLFRRWARRAQLDVLRLRGSRWENER